MKFSIFYFCISLITGNISALRIPRLIELCSQEQLNDTKEDGIRYFESTGKCYPLLSQGPCGNNMAFYAKDNIHGECGCIIDDRLLIYDRNSKQCYYIFQQGYCKDGYIMDVTRQGIPICSRNPCAALIKQSGKDLVWFNEKCAEVGKSASGCESGNVVGFLKNKRSPICKPSRSLPPISRAIGVPNTPCNLGSPDALDGRCNPPFDFD